VALERQSIEKKDFPIGRRGYDPDAVDAHLAQVAAEVEELKRHSRRRSENLASSASEQVRAIVEAAETTAAEIQRQAEDEASEIRADAASEAQATREQAATQAREYVSKVSEATTVMMQRLDAMDSELVALVESLRTGGHRLNADLQLLEGNLGEVRDSVGPRPRFELEPAAPAPPPPRPARPARPARPPVSPPPSPPAETPPQPVPGPAGDYDYDEDQDYDDERDPGADGGDAAGQEDLEGARLIALNMALNRAPREETDRYLAENFSLRDRRALLDEVYASVED
jgi:DivIVA domain-containing protein